MNDIHAQQAREHHRLSQQADAEAARHREIRDRLVRRLRESDPDSWSYGSLARAVGCSPELIAYIVKHPSKIETRLSEEE